MFYQAFVKDGLRLYKALPNSLKIRYWGIFVIQFLAAVTETFTLLVISLFAMSVAFSEAARNHFMVKPLLALSPALKSYCDDPRNFVTFTCSLMVAFIALKVSLSIFSSHKTTLFSENVALHISQETLRRFLGKNYFWHLSPDSSSVILKLMNRVVLSQFLVLLLQLYSNVLCCLALFTSMAIIEPKLTLAVMSIFFTASLSAYLFLRRRIDRAGHQVAALSADETAGMMVVNRGIREIIIYHRQEIFLNRVINLIRRGIKPRAFLAFSGNVPGQFLEFIGFSTVAIIMITMIVSGLPMPEIAAASSVLLLTAWRVLPSVSRSLSFTVAIRGLRPQALSSLELLEIFIAENPEKPPAPNPDFHFEKTVGLYEASFHYPAAGADALTKITAVVEKGWNVGLIGPSGAGKSTLALLLSGLVAPQSGRFLSMGKPCRQKIWPLTLSWLVLCPKTRCCIRALWLTMWPSADGVKIMTARKWPRPARWRPWISSSATLWALTCPWPLMARACQAARLNGWLSPGPCSPNRK